VREASLDHLECLDGGRRLRAARLGADHDRRRVMGDGVMQLARQSLALAEPDLLGLARRRR
jgi:hypothetical protein